MPTPERYQERGSQIATKKLDEFKAPSLWRDLHRAFRRQPGEPLFFSEAEYKGGRSEFVAREVPRLLKLKERTEPERPVELTEPEPGVTPRFPILWNSIDEKARLRLERLQLTMYFAQTDDLYRAAEKEFDAFVRRLKPKKRKSNVVRANLLPLLTYYAERIFFWAILKGDYAILEKRYRNADQRIRRLENQLQ